MIRPNDVIKYQNISCTSALINQINFIAQNTKNTWQQKRLLREIQKDTTIGKIAEHTLKDHIEKHSDYLILDYDDFRIDNYKKHAPIDSLIYVKDNALIQLAIKKINNDVVNSPVGALSKSTKRFLIDSKIYTLEIKSTRIRNRHCDSTGSISLEKVITDDFLTYPKFFRSVPESISINNWQQYRKYCIAKQKICESITLEMLQNIELENMYDYYARVYVNELGNDKFDVFIIGYIGKETFIKKSVVKRMQQNGKSERAIYIATSLKNGTPFKTIKNKS